ncbi:hypothetical protein CL634_02265 [bacterium]|nr:hypothetical protein [bacterium]
MPYIKQGMREKLIDYPHPQTSGELNYMITNLIIKYAKDHPGYSGINDVVGALEGAKLEFYRRYAAPYEDLKIAENGDVYG